MGELRIFNRPVFAWGTPRQKPEMRSIVASLLAEMNGGASGATVTTKTGMAIPTVYRAIQIISQFISTMPLKLMVEESDGKRPAKEHSLYNILTKKPNRWQTSLKWRELMAAQVLVYGNSYSYIVRDGNARPIEIVPLMPGNCEPALSDNKIFYKCKQSEVPAVVKAEDILHVYNLAWDGLTGVSPIRQFAQTLGISIAATKYGADFFGKGGQLEYVMSMPGKLDMTRKDHYKDQFLKMRSGGGVAVLDEGMSLQKMTLPPEEAQFLETRKFGDVDIARMYGVPNHMLNMMGDAKYANVEQTARDFYDQTIAPFVTNIEAELNAKLLGVNEQNYYVKHMFNGVLRADAQSRAEFYSKMVHMGAMSTNEVRGFEDMNAFEAGNEHYIDVNMQPMSKVDALFDAKIENLTLTKDGKSERTPV